MCAVRYETRILQNTKRNVYKISFTGLRFRSFICSGGFWRSNNSFANGASVSGSESDGIITRTRLPKRIYRSEIWEITRIYRNRIPFEQFHFGEANSIEIDSSDMECVLRWAVIAYRITMATALRARNTRAVRHLWSQWGVTMRL